MTAPPPPPARGQRWLSVAGRAADVVGHDAETYELLSGGALYPRRSIRLAWPPPDHQLVAGPGAPWSPAWWPRAS